MAVYRRQSLCGFVIATFRSCASAGKTTSVENAGKGWELFLVNAQRFQ